MKNELSTSEAGSKTDNRFSCSAESNFERLCVSDRSTIFMAMEAIELGRERLCFVVDDENTLIRVISDGDIRRALLGGYSLDDAVRDIHDKTPVVVHENNTNTATQKLNQKISLAPIIDVYGKISGLMRYNDYVPYFNIRERSVAVIGLGYVGLTLSLVLADNGFSVSGYDTDKALVDKLRNKKTPFYENGLENLLLTHVGTNFCPIGTIDSLDADVYIVTVGTPIIPGIMKPNIEHICKAVAVIADRLKKNDMVILRSTVPVGCTRTEVIPLLEKVSGLRAGEDFHIAFCPERTAEGRALKELRELPQIIGGIDQQSRELAMRLFNENTHTVIDVGSIEAAEMCKLLDNTYRDTMFAYSNQMARLTEKLGLNLHELITKVNLGYGRNKIPYPSPGVGGPCLSKDPYILEGNFSAFGLESKLISAARSVNEAAPELIFQRCKAMMSRLEKNILHSKIFIIGFAFKGEPVTSDLRDSTTVWLLEYLRREGARKLFGYDPVIGSEELSSLELEACELEDGFNNADLVIFMNNHKSYSNLNINMLLATMNKPSILYDGWNIFQPKEIRNNLGIMYAATGVG